MIRTFGNFKAQIESMHTGLEAKMFCWRGVKIAKVSRWNAYPWFKRQSFPKCINVKAVCNCQSEIYWKLHHLSVKWFHIFQKAWFLDLTHVGSNDLFALPSQVFFECFFTTSMWYTIKNCPFQITQKQFAPFLHSQLHITHIVSLFHTFVNLNHQAFEYKTSKDITNQYNWGFPMLL